MTDAEYQAWLQADTTLRCLLVEITYRDTVTEAIGVEYMATVPFVSSPNDTPQNQSYAAIIDSIPTFSQRMSDLLLGRTTANVGNIEVFAGTSETDDWIFSRDWVGRSVVMYLGAPDWEKLDFRAVWTGVIADVNLSATDKLVFVARDMQHLLNQPAIVNPISTEADVAKPLPLCYGTCYNVSAVLINNVTHQYAVHDGPIQAITAVYADGVAAAYTASLATGTFTLTTAPSGQVTANVQGAVVDGVFLQKAGELLQHFATSRGALPIANVDTASMTALDSLCPQPLGVFIGSVVTNVYQLMDMVAATVGAYYAINRDGKLYAKRFDFNGTPVLTIQQEDIVVRGLTLTKIKAAVKQLLLGGPKNWTIQKNAASAVAEDRRATLGAGTFATGINNPLAGNYGKVVDPGLIDTMFSLATDAAAEGTRRMTLWGVPRYGFTVQCFTAPMQLNLGDTVTLIHPRYGLSAGRNGVVVELAERPSKKEVALGVLI